MLLLIAPPCGPRARQRTQLLLLSFRGRSLWQAWVVGWWGVAGMVGLCTPGARKGLGVATLPHLYHTALLWKYNQSSFWHASPRLWITYCINMTFFNLSLFSRPWISFLNALPLSFYVLRGEYCPTIASAILLVKFSFLCLLKCDHFKKFIAATIAQPCAGSHLVLTKQVRHPSISKIRTSWCCVTVSRLACLWISGGTEAKCSILSDLWQRDGDV